MLAAGECSWEPRASHSGAFWGAPGPGRCCCALPTLGAMSSPAAQQLGFAPAALEALAASSYVGQGSAVRHRLIELSPHASDNLSPAGVAAPQ